MAFATQMLTRTLANLAITLAFLASAEAQQPTNSQQPKTFALVVPSKEIRVPRAILKVGMCSIACSTTSASHSCPFGESCSCYCGAGGHAFCSGCSKQGRP